MNTCFVIQPFDGGKFDKRFADVFRPAIEDAQLEAYRVDQDLSVSIPIDEIYMGIKRSAVCLADISLDNPNVWFELGFAIAAEKPVVMVCSEERTTKFPFDVQHRLIIKYRTDSPSDFVHLQKQITTKILAEVAKDAALQQIANGQVLADVAGISQHELMVLATIAGDVDSFTDPIAAYSIKSKVQKHGLTDFAANLGIRKLHKRDMLESRSMFDDFGNPYPGYLITTRGWDWIEANEDKFNFTKPREEVSDDEIPF